MKRILTFGALALAFLAYQPVAQAAQGWGLPEEEEVRFDAPVITTSGSGVTAALAAFLLTQAGHPEVSVYDGSWAEWGNADGFPIETGPAR